MLTRAALSVPLTEIQQHDLENILKYLRPLNVEFIERIRNVGLFRKLPPGIICFLIAVSLSVPVHFLAALQLNLTAEKDIISYLLTFTIAVSYITLALWGTQILFALAHNGVLTITSLANPDDITSYLVIWAKKDFSMQAQLRIMVLFGVPFAILNVISVVISWGLTLGVVIAGLWLGIIFGLTLGNLIHFYLKVSSLASGVFTTHTRLHSLAPAETILIRVILGIVLQSVLIFASFASFIFILYLVAGIVNFNRMDTSTILAFGISSWLLQLFPLVRTILFSNIIIRSAKNKTLIEIQMLIDQAYKKLTSTNSPEALEYLNELLKLYDLTKKSPDLPIDFGFVVRLMASFIFPLIPVLLQHLLGL